MRSCCSTGCSTRSRSGSRPSSSPASISTGNLVQLLLVAAVFGIVNSLLRPLLTVLTCPLIVLTLGPVHPGHQRAHAAGHRLAVGAVGLGFRVTGFWPAFWGGLVVGLVSLVLSLLFPRPETEPRA